MDSRRADLDSFYELLSQLEQRCGGKRLLRDCDGRMPWPTRGVYFFFEAGEFRGDGDTPRVVRVGTHALRPSSNTLWKRLRQHRGFVAGAMPGGGNHRGSIFRLHVGSALLDSAEWPDAARRTWSHGNSAPKSTQLVEWPLEKAVSTYIGAMPFLWLEVDDPPSRLSDRGAIEAGAIALLSNHDRPAIDPPSPQWLGRHADRRLVRESGLWNVDHVARPAADTFLATLARHLQSSNPG